jgi:hypothetical protein
VDLIEGQRLWLFVQESSREDWWCNWLEMKSWYRFWNQSILTSTLPFVPKSIETHQHLNFRQVRTNKQWNEMIWSHENSSSHDDEVVSPHLIWSDLIWSELSLPMQVRYRGIALALRGGHEDQNRHTPCCAFALWTLQTAGHENRRSVREGEAMVGLGEEIRHSDCLPGVRRIRCHNWIPHASSQGRGGSRCSG